MKEKLSRRDLLKYGGKAALGLYLAENALTRMLSPYRAYAANCKPNIAITNDYEGHIERGGPGALDFYASNMPVVPAAAGRVFKTMWQDVNDGLIVVSHGLDWYTLYGHITPIEEGRFVNRKTMIGQTYPHSHLHFALIPPRFRAKDIYRNHYFSRLLGLDTDFYSADPKDFGISGCLNSWKGEDLDSHFLKLSTHAKKYVDSVFQEMLKSNLVSSNERTLIALIGSDEKSIVANGSITQKYGNLRRLDRKMQFIEDKLRKDGGKESADILDTINFYKTLQPTLTLPFPL